MSKAEKEKKGLSILEKVLSIVTSITTIGCGVFGLLWNDAKNATVQIDQPNGPLEVRLVDFPGVYGNLMDEKEGLETEKKNLETEKQDLLAVIADEKALLEFSPSVAQAPEIPTTAGDPLFPMMLKNERNWKATHGEPRDGRETTFDPKDFAVAWKDGYAEYVVDKKYTTLIGTIASHFEMENNEGVVTIWANDRQIYKSPVIKNTSKALTFSASLEGTDADIIKIHVSNGPLLLMDFEMHSPTTPAPTTAPIQATPGDSLFVMTMKNEEWWQVNTGEPRDGRGAAHSPKHFALAGAESWGGQRPGRAEFILTKEYTTLTGTVAPHFNMINFETVLTIWANERQIYKSPAIKNTSLPISFNVSLAGIEADFIKVEASGGPLLLMDFNLS